MKAALAFITVALAGAAVAHAIAAPPPVPVTLPAPVARPDAALLGIRVDYVAPLETPEGGVADLAPLQPEAAAAAFADLTYLHYQLPDDLGGFVRAPVGAALFEGIGHNIVGATRLPELPLFAQAAGGGIRSYTFTGGGATVNPPENGHQPVPGLGVPPVVPPPTGTNTPPPPNQGFGGRPSPPPTTTTTATTTTPPPTTMPTTTTTRTATTTTGTTTTRTTTTTTGTTTTPTPTPPPPPSAGDCGAPGIAITSNRANCRIVATNMAPGDATTEELTVTNTTGSPYTLALKATGTQNRLWQDLRMGVWEKATAPPSPLPPLLDWTTQFNDLRTLDPGQSVTYIVELFLPTSAGNADQNLTAVIDFAWRATG